MDQKKIAKEVERKIEAVKKTAGKESDKIKKELEKVRTQMSKATKKVEDFVKKNPAKASAIAAGIGAILGAGIASLTKFGKNKNKKTKKK